MKYVLCLSLVIAIVPGAYAALPGNSINGKRLHDANCTACHDTGVYTRKDRRVQSLDALKRQIQSCNHMAKTHFSAPETQDVVKYLNDQFYRFP